MKPKDRSALVDCRTVRDKWASVPGTEEQFFCDYSRRGDLQTFSGENTILRQKDGEPPSPCSSGNADKAWGWSNEEASLAKVSVLLREDLVESMGSLEIH